MVEMKGNMVILDKATREIHIYYKGKTVKVTRIVQDSLNRAYIYVMND